MILSIFSVRDSAVEAFMQPFFSPTRGAAIRSLTEVINDPKHEFHKNAKDYALYYLGTFDDANGVITPPEGVVPVPIIACIDLMNKG